MKPKFLLDECVNSKKDYEANLFVRTVDCLGRGASDQKILDYAIKHKLIPITADIRFTLRLLQVGHPVVYRTSKGVTTLIRPKPVSSPMFSDQVTYHVLKKGSVVLP